MLVWLFSISCLQQLASLWDFAEDKISYRNKSLNLQRQTVGLLDPNWTSGENTHLVAQPCTAVDTSRRQTRCF